MKSKIFFASILIGTSLVSTAAMAKVTRSCDGVMAVQVWDGGDFVNSFAENITREGTALTVFKARKNAAAAIGRAFNDKYKINNDPNNYVITTARKILKDAGYPSAAYTVKYLYKVHDGAGNGCVGGDIKSYTYNYKK